MKHNWTNEEYISRAKKEPERLKFWLQYFPKDELEASQCVCNNSPDFDKNWVKQVGTPEQFCISASANVRNVNF